VIKIDLRALAAEPGAAGIIGVNAVVMLGAIASGDGPLMLMFPYWLQSVIIGGYNVRRIAVLQVFTTDGLKVNGRAVDPTPSTRRETWIFFMVHYGFFHLVYFFFLGAFGAMDRGGGFGSSWGDLGSLSSLWLGATALGFLVSEGRDYARARAEDVATPPNIGSLMFAPYFRIIPMHLTIIFGALFGGWFAILLFGTLKTLVELVINALMHAKAQAGPPGGPPAGPAAGPAAAR
jgi:hypothetical protein